MKFYIILFFLFISSIVNGQNQLKKALQKETNFYTIVENAEQYFQSKHPTLSSKDLTSGVHRDGEFVKYMRWKNFWKNHLQEDGQLGNIPLSNDQMRSSSNNNVGLYDHIPWTNLSYENYITGQISLGRTTSIAFHPTNPNIFYVGAAIGGVWKTTDGGQNYTAIGDELPFLAVSNIVVDQNTPSTIYITISDHVWYGPPGIGVYKSIDGGLTWNSTALSLQFTNNTRMYKMVADPSNSSILFVATASGLYRTIDGFTTSTTINTFDCRDIRFKPNDSNTLYLTTNDGKFYRSTDAGSTFSEIIDFGNGASRIAVTDLDNQLIAVQNGSTLYQSTNSGVSFPNSQSLPESNTVITYSPNNQNTILAGNFEIYRSDDNGTNYNVLTNWLGNSGLPLIHVDQRNVVINPLENNYVYYCNDGGVYRYDLTLNSFEDLSDGLAITQYYDIAVAQTNSNVISGGSQDNGSMFRNTSGVWEEFASTGDGMNTEIDPTDHNTLYWEYQNGSLHRMVNGINSNISPPSQSGNGAWETPYRLDPTNPSRIIVGYDVVYESLDKGNNWTIISSQLASGSDLNHIAISKSNPNRIYAVHGTTLFVKDVSSNTWTTKSTPASISISDIEVDPLNMDVIYVTNSGYSNNNKVFKSIDAGDNWTNISTAIPNISVGAIETYDDRDGGIFLGTDYGVYYRDNQSTNWESYGNMPNTRVTDIEIQYADQLIRVGTHGRGVLEAPIDIIKCEANFPDADNDGICDLLDACPNLDDNTIGQPCDDGDALSSNETYTNDCICGGGVSTLSYCGAAGSTGTGSDWISGVRLHTLDHISAKTIYSDFKQYNTTLQEGQTYTLEVQLNYAFPPDEAYGWIDYNRNGAFENSEEIIISAFNSNHISSGTFTVPTLSAYGATTMRVRNIYADPNTADPCGTYAGEVEDYTIHLKGDCLYYSNIANTAYLTGDNSLEIVEHEITSTNTTIRNGANIMYNAGDNIYMSSDFEVQLGASFEAFINGCNP